MKIEKIVQAGFAVKAIALEMGATKPERANPHRKRHTRLQKLNHILFLGTCIEILCDSDVAMPEKAMRFLAFAQGWLSTMGRPIHDMKLMNWKGANA